MIPSNIAVVLRSLMTIAIGGAAFSAEDWIEAIFASAAGGKPVSVDWHQLGMRAMLGAALALANHFRKPLTAPAVTPAVKP